uniref:Uncharacterized protein n=1 Tax=Magallana gigas TaxID=29159 RepID=K1Q0P7_MAGGI
MKILLGMCVGRGEGGQTAILDGRNGKSLLGSPILDTMGAQASPLTISIEGYGNDELTYMSKADPISVVCDLNLEVTIAHSLFIYDVT